MKERDISIADNQGSEIRDIIYQHRIKHY